jgi:hypothetical protein
MQFTLYRKYTRQTSVALKSGCFRLYLLVKAENPRLNANAADARYRSIPITDDIFCCLS